MKIDIWYLKFPSNYEGVEELKKFIGSTAVKAYSLDENNVIIEGLGWIGNDDSYNYHNNYDDSEDCLFFEGKKKWFSQDVEKVKEVQIKNNKIILETLNPYIDRAVENL